ncbi:MAG: hypothetical protein U1F57_00995 [bacterium]
MKILRYFFILTAAYLAVLPTMGCFTTSDAPPKNSSQARLNLPNWGIVIDATYDRKLDGIVPGYKIMTVALTNRSTDLIKLDPNNDQWFIEDAWGKKQKGIISLRIKDPQTWNTLPPKVKDLVEYPAGVQMGFTQTFDLFFPDQMDLDRFRSISFYSAVLKQNFDALSSASLERAVPADDTENANAMEKYRPATPAKKANASKKYNGR